MFIANSTSQHPQVASDARNKARQCIVWLNKIGSSWRDANRYSRILTSLEVVGQHEDFRGSQRREAAPNTSGSGDIDSLQQQPQSERHMAAPQTTTGGGGDGAATSPSQKTSVSPGTSAANVKFWNEVPHSLDSHHWHSFTTTLSHSLTSSDHAGTGGAEGSGGDERPLFIPHDLDAFTPPAGLFPRPE